MNHPETAALAKAAYAATGAQTHAEFIAIVDGAISLRSFRRWLAGEGPADPLAKFILTQLSNGWRPAK